MKKILFFTIIITLFYCCGNDTEGPNDIQEKEAPVVTQMVNEFIEKEMQENYLWSEEMPKEIDTRYENDSKEYFNKLIYTDDKWSFITDDYEGLINSLQGRENTFGYSLAFAKDEKDNYYGIIQYVYPGTPASEAGLKRGDVILLLNGKKITKDNYTNLLYKRSINITIGESDNGTLKPGKSYDLSSKEIDLNPILHYSVLGKDEHKIGYLFYTTFIDKYNENLDKVFKFFKEENITDLIIDLRYNPGGDLTAAKHLCSCIAPQSVIKNEKTLITKKWNKNIEEYWESKNIPQIEKYSKDVPYNVNMSKVYIITGQGTASSSELTITALRPYMDVVLVGETTHGKYVGSTTIRPMRVSGGYKTVIKEIKNWAIQPIIMKYTNANGETDFKEGFKPNIEIKDNPVTGFQIGDPNDLMLNKAITTIIGATTKSALKTSTVFDNYIIFDRGFSKFDKLRNTIIDNTFQQNENISK